MLLADRMTLADGWSRQAMQLATAHTAAAVRLTSAHPTGPALPSWIMRGWHGPSGQQFTQPDGNNRHTSTANEPAADQDESNIPPTIAVVAAGLRGSPPKLVPNDPIRLIEPAAAADRAIVSLGVDAGEEIARRDNEILSLESSLALVLSENQDLSARLTTREAEVGELRLELAQLKTALTAIADEHDALKRVTDQADNENVAFTEIRTDLDRATAALTRAVTERDTATSILKKVNEQRTIEVNAFTSELSALYSRAVAVEQQLEATQRKLRLRSEETDRIIKDNEQLSRHVAQGDALRESLSAQLKRAKSALSSAEKRSAALSIQLAEINDEHKNHISALKMRLASVSSRAAAAERKMVQARQSLSEKFTLLHRSLQLKAHQADQLTHAPLLQTADSGDNTFTEAGTNIEWLVENVTTSSVGATEISRPRPTAALLTATITF
jgi:hypothetical protein